MNAACPRHDTGGGPCVCPSPVSIHDPLHIMSNHTFNSLCAAGLLNEGDIRDALDRGRLAHMPNIGKTSIGEIRRWLDYLEQEVTS